MYLFAHLLNEPVGVSHYLAVGAVLFVCGAICMATKRNALGVLMGIASAAGVLIGAALVPYADPRFIKGTLGVVLLLATWHMAKTTNYGD